MKYSRYVYFSFGGINLTVFNSQVKCWIEEAKRIYPKTELIVVEGFKSRKVQGLSRFRLDNNVLCYHYLLPLLNISLLWVDVAILYVKLFRARNIFNNAVIHCRSEIMCYVARELIKLYGSKGSYLVCDIRGDSIDEIKNKPMNRIHKRMLLSVYNKCLSYSCENADLITTVTGRLRDTVFERTGLSKKKYNSLVVPTIVHPRFVFNEKVRNDKRRELGIPDGSKVWIYTGGLDYWQNPDKIFGILIEKLKDPEVFVILLTQHMETAGVVFKEFVDNKRVVIRSVPYSEVPDYLSASDTGLIVRDNSSTNSCASPVKLSEYLCNGLEIYSTGEIGVLNDIKLAAANLSRTEKSIEYMRYFSAAWNFERARSVIEHVI